MTCTREGVWTWRLESEVETEEGESWFGVFFGLWDIVFLVDERGPGRNVFFEGDGDGIKRHLLGLEGVILSATEAIHLLRGMSSKSTISFSVSLLLSLSSLVISFLSRP